MGNKTAITNTKEFYTISDFIELSNLSVTKIRAYQKSGFLPIRRINPTSEKGWHIFYASDIENMKKKIDKANGL